MSETSKKYYVIAAMLCKSMLSRKPKAILDRLFTLYKPLSQDYLEKCNEAVQAGEIREGSYLKIANMLRQHNHNWPTFIDAWAS